MGVGNYPYYGVQAYPQQQNFQMQNFQQGQQGMIWVSSLQDAQSYLVAPNSSVALWDCNAPRVYQKQADATGRPTLKIYDLVEHKEEPPTPAPLPVSREEFEALVARVDSLGKKPSKKEAAE